MGMDRWCQQTRMTAGGPDVAGAGDGLPAHADRPAETQMAFARQVGAARDGSDEAIGDLLQHCRNYLLLAANRQVAPRIQVKVAPSDLVQETFQAALDKFGEFRGETERELLAWLVRILRSRYSRATKRYQSTQKRNIHRELPLAQNDSGAWAELGVEAPGQTPRTAAIAGEDAEAVFRALAGLPDSYRRVIRLRNWERHSFGRIGQEMNRSAAAARKLWSRAVDRLGLELESLDDSRRPAKKPRRSVR